MTVLDDLRSSDLMLGVELRPPRADLDRGDSMDSWIAMNATVRGLLARRTPLFLTDGAVGTAEEENLHHLVTNLEEDVSRELICPFLTTKHTLEYCLWYAARALEAGCPALTVLGGDVGVGAPRCVPHGYLLRQAIRERFPSLALGGWANPHGDAARQASFVAAPEFTADFYLTQLVSHLDLAPVEQFLRERDRQGVTVPGVFGVFYYRSGRRKTLERLARFFPVPVDAVVAEFEAGLSAAEICAKTIRALQSLGITKFYVSNLHDDRAAGELTRIARLVQAG